LATLMKCPGQLRTRNELLNEVWGYDKTMITRTVDTHVRRLRRKLGKWGEAIKTVRSYGYRLDSLLAKQLQRKPTSRGKFLQRTL
jgi:DNA-binding response OmpR family regulator